MDDPATQSCDFGELMHHLAVREDIGSTDLEHAIECRRFVQHPDQVREDIAHGDRLTPGLHPAGSDHRREHLDEMAQHLERRTARTDHHRGAQFGGGNRTGREHLAHLVAAAEMIGQGGPGVVAQSAEIDDLSGTGAGCGVTEVGGGLSVPCLPIVRAADRMHEVVGPAHPGEGAIEGVGVENVAGDDLDTVGPHLVGEFRWRASQRPHPMTGLHEFTHQTATDVAGGAGHQDRRSGGRLGRGGCRRLGHGRCNTTPARNDAGRSEKFGRSTVRA